MFVGYAAFELHIESAQSLKEKRTVVRSLRDRLRRKFEISVAEVGLNDLHQRARIGVAVVSNSARNAGALLEKIASWIDGEAGGRVTGWTQEIISVDTESQLGIPRYEFSESDFLQHEEESEDDTDR